MREASLSETREICPPSVVVVPGDGDGDGRPLKQREWQAVAAILRGGNKIGSETDETRPAGGNFRTRSHSFSGPFSMIWIAFVCLVCVGALPVAGQLAASFRLIA